MAKKLWLLLALTLQRKEIYKGTWRSPNGCSMNQFGHVSIEITEEKVIKNMRSYRGLDANHTRNGKKV